MDMLSFLMGKACSGSGGGSSIIVEALTATENKTYTAPEGKAYSPVTVNVPVGGGGLEYEEGTYSPSENTAMPTINFKNSHTTPPSFVLMADTTGTAAPVTNSNHAFSYVDWNIAFGNIISPDMSPATDVYGMVYYLYSSATRAGLNIIQLDSSSSSSSRAYWVDKAFFKPSSASASRYWIAGRTYKWIAVWAPES